MEYKFINEVPKEEGSVVLPVSEKIIEKRGLVIKFTYNELVADKAKFEKTLKELKANCELKQGILDNMDQHHPFIKEMSEFDRYAVHMYQEAWAARKAYTEKIDEIEKDFNEYLKEIEDIKSQLPELGEIVSPMQPDESGEIKEVAKDEIVETPIANEEENKETTE